MIRTVATVTGVALLALAAAVVGPLVFTREAASPPAVSIEPTPAPSTIMPQAPTRHISVTDFGVRPDDGADDTTGLQKALASLRRGDTLVLPPGVYHHSAVLELSVPGVSITGPGATLQATEESSSAFHIDADDVQVSGLTFTTPITTRRWSGLEQHKIWISEHRGVRLSGVTVLGSAAAGVFVEGTHDFRLDGVTVRDTRADGIHVTDGASGGVIDHPTVSGTGDDGIAVVSYEKDPTPCSGITVNSPRVLGTTWGRGVTIVGGNDIDYNDVYVERSNAAGIYVAAEGSPWYTRSVDNVQISGGRVVGTNENSDIDQGAVLVYLGRADAHVTDVHVSGITVENTRATASRNIGVIGTGGIGPTDVIFSGMTIVGGPAARYGGNTPPTSYRVTP